MPVDFYQFQLTPEDIQRLRQLDSCSDLVNAVLAPDMPERTGTTTISLNQAQAESLRDCLTARLAANGFDENYVPNEQGRALESLIDKFHIRR